MLYLSDLIESVHFMELNMKNKITISDIANHIGYSPYHYIRLFHAVTKETPWNYLRKRRLTEAAKDLKTAGGKILDVAFDYQFESSDAFSRAFSNYFFITPKRCKESNNHIPLFYKEVLTITRIKDRSNSSLVPVFKTLPEMKLLGVVYYGKNEQDEIASLWTKHIGQLDQLKNIVEPIVTYGYCFHTEEYKENGNFYYLISKHVHNLKQEADYLVSKEIPQTEYAIFTHKGDVSLLSHTYQYIYGEWLPKYKYKDDETFNMEVYSKVNGELKIEIYIPLKN